jgi:hypothetical protein
MKLFGLTCLRSFGSDRISTDAGQTNRLSSISHGDMPVKGDFTFLVKCLAVSVVENVP